MSPDDPRHGSTGGFHAGCRCAPCRAALARYEKRRRYDIVRGARRAIPAIGAQRRIQGLMRLGWTAQDIADEVGWSHRNRVLRILNGQRGKPCTWIERNTDAQIRKVFKRLSMRLPEPGPYVTRTIRRAERLEWAPPLAWDNIDDPAERPKGAGKRGRTTEIRATRAAELEHLAHIGENLHTACDRLEVTVDALWKWCNRHDHLDLYERLAERSRKRDNQYSGKRGAA